MGWLPLLTGFLAGTAAIGWYGYITTDRMLTDAFDRNREALEGWLKTIEEWRSDVQFFVGLLNEVINEDATTDRSPSVVVGTAPGSPVSHGGVEPGVTDEGDD